jgi:hypothetical protein
MPETGATEGFTGVYKNSLRMARRSFDSASVPPSRWLAGGGALALLISLFLDWFGVDGYSQTGWDAFTGDKLIGLFAVVAIVLVGLDLFGAALELPVDPAQLLLGCGALSLLIVVLRLIDLSHFKVGIFVALLAAAALTAGGWLEQQERSR